MRWLWGGSSLEDQCGVCDADPANDCTQDCAGSWGGSALEDCGVCDEIQQMIVFKIVLVHGAEVQREDQCGTCDADPTNDCTQDVCKTGSWGGSALDQCGVCDADPANDCTQDCAGSWGGSATDDQCV